MTTSPRPVGWLAFLGGAGVFLAVQWLLFRNAVPVLGISDSGWFLNSDRGVAAVCAACAVAGIIAGFTSHSSSLVRNATLLAIGAVSAMTMTLVRIGPGSIFPIVVIFGTGIIAGATAAGAGVGMAARRVFGLNGSPAR